MTDVLRIAHPQNCPPYGNSRVGICEGNLVVIIVVAIIIVVVVIVAIVVIIKVNFQSL